LSPAKGGAPDRAAREEDACGALAAGNVAAGDVVVIRYGGTVLSTSLSGDATADIRKELHGTG
jgi:hypothetical protein